MTKNSLFGLSAVCFGFLSGCQSRPNAAFPTAQTLASTKAGQGADISSLERGRKLYTTSCTECHVARSIAHYSPTQWQHFIGIMAPRAGLKLSDRAALEAYLLAARESMEGGSSR
jgi:mono/diheme cytochrome c family protein